MEIGQQIKIEKIILHQDYSSKTSLNDIALLKLDQPAKVAPNIRPACVSSKTQLERKKFTIIGFGVINNKGSKIQSETFTVQILSFFFHFHRRRKV